MRLSLPGRIAAVLSAMVLVGSGVSVASAATQPAPRPNVTSTLTVAGPGWLHTDGATIKTAGNAPYVIKGAAWFGLETSNCAPHGLWSISLDAGLAQIKSMGFNTVRLPYSNECLAAKAGNSINYQLNPTLQGLSPLQIMDAVVARAKAYGLNVLLDQHRPDSGSQSALWYTDRYSEATWISDWKMLAKRYLNEPTVIGVDLHNEPSGAACWGCGNVATDWRAAATRAGNAVQGVNPKLLIVVEGVEKQPDGSSTWWGGGLSGVAAKPVTLTVANHVVYSPHDYPASVYNQTWFSAPNYPANLPGVWDKNWGFIAKNGTAPVLLGEFGTRLETDSDRKWLATVVTYLSTNSLSFAYWSFNPNSGDTGGLVKDDWVTPQAAKLAALRPLIGTGTPTPVQTPAPVSAPTTTPTATPKPSTAPTPTAKPTVTPKPSPTPSSTPTPTATPKPSSIPTPTPASTPAQVPAVNAEWMLQSSWGAGYVADIVVTSATGASRWSVTWPDAASTSIVNAWGMDCTIAPRTSITCTGKDWAGRLAAGQTVRVGLQVAATAAPNSPVVTVTVK
ncbi:hypothetical protein BH09ACT6_BH09ACT6_12540 [soil metagenome]